MPGAKAKFDLENEITHLKLEINQCKSRIQNLRVWEQTYRLLAENSREMVLTIDLDRRITHLNRAAVLKIGQPLEVLLGKPIHDTLPDINALLIDKLFSDYHTDRGNAYAHHMELTDARQHRIPVEAVASLLVLDDQPYGALISLKDITRRLQSQEALNRLTAIIEATSDLVLTFAADMRITYVNQAARNLFGWQQDLVAVPHLLSDIYIPQEWHLIETERMATAVTNGIWVGETEVLDKKEQLIPASQVLMAHSLPSGKVEYFSTILRDISASREAQKIQKEGIETARALLNATHSVALLIDPQERVLAANQGAAQRLQLPEEAVVGQSLRDLLPHLGGAEILAKTKAVLDAKEAQHFDRVVDDLQFFDTLYPVFDDHGNVSQVAYYSTDVTQQKVVEQELRESRAKYQSILENMEDGYFEVDLKGYFTFSNNAFCKLLGYTPDELTGVHYRQVVNGETVQMLRLVFNRIFRTGEPERIYEYEISQKEGRIRTVEMYVALHRDLRQKPNGFKAMVRDVTDERKLRAELQHAQKMQSVGTMASGTAHNFRNVLAAISANNQLLQMRIDADSPVFEATERIERTIKKGSQLVEGLMQFARKDRRKQFKIINLIGIIEESIEIFRRTVSAPVQIRTYFDPELPVMGDRSGISQVIMNLMTNAFDAMPAQGGEIFVEAIAEHDMARITVSDNGIGMDKSTLEKCFDPFFTTKEMGKGTGLGLSTSYGVIKEHGGTIHATSRVGRGTRFMIGIPLVAMSSTRRSDHKPEMIQGQQQKILLVDDDQEVLYPTQDILKRMGFRVRAAGSGEDALKVYVDWRPQVVLMDRVMPKMDGIECARRLNQIDARARVILISGLDKKGLDGLPEEDQNLIEVYLTKPLDFRELSRIVDKIAPVPPVANGQLAKPDPKEVT